MDDIRHVSDRDSREISPERETAYLLQTEAMRQRLLEARERREGISLEEAREKLGMSERSGFDKEAVEPIDESESRRAICIQDVCCQRSSER